MSIIVKALDVELAEESQEELKNSLYYAAEDIKEIVFPNSTRVRIKISDEANPKELEQKITKMINRFLENYNQNPYKVIFKHDIPIKNRERISPRLLESGAIFKLDEGQYGLSGICLELLDYFNNSIKNIGVELGAVEHRYPTLIPIKALQRINYLSSRPESLNFVSHLKEDIDIIDAFALEAKHAGEEIFLGTKVNTASINSSAVCFHTYHHFQDKELDAAKGRFIIGAVGKCFRYETKNMDSLERLRDFTMREVICLGLPEQVSAFRKEVLDRAKKLIEEWGLNCIITTANDPFFIKEFASQSMFQKTFQLKYELKTLLPFKNSRLAIGSINNHRDFLGKSFNIKHKGEFIHSSCLAYGLERCVYAFLAQYGTDKSNWPAGVLEKLNSK